MCTYCLKQDGSIPTYEEWLDMMAILEQLAQEEYECWLHEDDCDNWIDVFHEDDTDQSWSAIECIPF